LFLPLFCYLLSGCVKDRELVPDTPSRTVLVYLGTDNNFSNEAAEKINTLKSYWDKNINGNLMVYADAQGTNPVLVHIYYNKRLGIVADTIEIYQAENSANPATLNRALNRVKQYCPAASSYGLVVLSHGSGWLPAEMSWPSIRAKSVIVDTSTREPNNYMEIWDFANAIPYKLDFVVFDVCFMGAVEVAYELKDKADYIVASPAEVLVPGFVYSTMMKHLFAPVPDVKAVAGDFYEYYNNQTGYYRSATVSVVKTSELDGLANVVKDITQKNAPLTDLSNIQTFGFGTQKIYLDLEDYFIKLSPENKNQIQTALDKCVIYKENTPSYYSMGSGMNTINAFSGLTVYVPQPAYPKANEEYGKLKWAKRIEYSNPF
jgi:hypothetical protein